MGIHEIRKRLEQWHVEDFYKNSKSFKEYKSNIVPGEYYYILTWRLNLTLFGISEPIIQVKKFHTQTLSPEPLSDNPNADLQRLNGLLPTFDTEFLQKVDEVYGKHIDDINPPGFLNL